nr:MAG TPA: minor structural protein [Caudoviricetes sp.]
MKREFLTELGLEKEAIDKIMAEYGKDINAEKEKLTALEQEKNALTENLQAANATIDGFKAKDLDVEKVQKLATEWQKKYEAAEQAREQQERNSALMQALDKTNTLDAELLKSCIDMDALVYKDGKYIGLDAQLESIKENKPYLFDSAKPKTTIKGAKIGDPSDLSTTGGEQVNFKEMTYSEIVDYVKQHPESAELLS